MDFKLSGKRALVSGASSAIGAEIARQLAAEGVRVVVHGRDKHRTEAVRDQITSAGGEAVIALGDLTNETDSEKITRLAAEAFGGLDILVNNVGGPTNTTHSTWFDAPLEEWTDNYRQNVLPAIRLVKTLVPAMQQRRWGRVIQISARNAISPHASLGGYGAAKAALNNLTLSLSKALAGSGVTSNGIMPGLIYRIAQPPSQTMMPKPTITKPKGSLFG